MNKITDKFFESTLCFYELSLLDDEVDYIISKIKTFYNK